MDIFLRGKGGIGREGTARAERNRLPAGAAPRPGRYHGRQGPVPQFPSERLSERRPSDVAGRTATASGRQGARARAGRPGSGWARARAAARRSRGPCGPRRPRRPRRKPGAGGGRRGGALSHTGSTRPPLAGAEVTAGPGRATATARRVEGTAGQRRAGQEPGPGGEPESPSRGRACGAAPSKGRAERPGLRAGPARSPQGAVGATGAGRWALGLGQGAPREPLGCVGQALCGGAPLCPCGDGAEFESLKRKSAATFVSRMHELGV